MQESSFAKDSLSVADAHLLYHISRRLNSDLDIDRILAEMLDLTVQRFGAGNGSVIIFDETGTIVHKILARAGMPSDQAEAVLAQVISQGLAGWVLEQRQGGIVYDVLSDARWISFPDDELVGGSAIGVPLLRGDRVVGVLTLRHPELGHFTDDHRALLSSIADQASIAVENARLYHSVQTERARMEAIINNAGDAVVVTDQQGCVVLMNAIAHQIFDTGQESHVPGQHLTELVRDRALGKLWEHRESSAYPLTEEIALPDGRTFYAKLTGVPDVGFVIVMQDITYLKQLDQAKSEFISAVSHDMRSPLQLVHTYASMISETGPLNERQREYMEGINRSVQKMGDLVDNLLSLAKIEAGVDMDEEPCHLDRIIAQVIARFQELAREKGLTLQSVVAPDLAPVRANVQRIDQVLSNLVDNAIKYTLQGTITVEAFVEERQVVVQVTDTGIGLLPQDQGKLFGRFFRAGSEQTADVEGTGLGLVIAKSIIEQYGGKIWAQSTWRKGSTFSFSLPKDGQG